MNLSDCYDSRNCDKGTVGKRKPGHQYWRVYEKCFEDLTGDFNILEIGILKGASMEAHLQYFGDRGMFYGIDDFSRVSLDHIRLESLKHDPQVRIETGDSTVKEPILFPDIEFDIIIDDGAHDPLSQRKTLDNYWPRLKSGGTYFIEDIFPFGKLTEDEIENLMRQYTIDRTLFNVENYNDLVAAINETSSDNTIHDLTAHSQKPDSIIVEIKK